MSDQKTPVTTDPSGISDLPEWRRPTFSILDVEAGTVTTSGPVSDGNGSTS